MLANARRPNKDGVRRATVELPHACAAHGLDTHRLRAVLLVTQAELTCVVAPEGQYLVFSRENDGVRESTRNTCNANPA